MKIILSPVSGYKTTTASLSGLVLTIDGVEYDLSVIPEGGQAEASEDSPFIGTVTRESVTIRYEYNSVKAEPDQPTNWADYTFEVVDGEVPCPIKWKPEPEQEADE